VVDAGPRTPSPTVWPGAMCPRSADDLSDVATDAFLVSEESILDGMRLLYRCSGLIVEASGRARHQPLLVALNDPLLKICCGNVPPQRMSPRSCLEPVAILQDRRDAERGAGSTINPEQR